MPEVFDVTYEACDYQLAAKDVFGPGLPSEEIRLVLDNHTPAIIMVSSFILYWFILTPFVFPATKPVSEGAINFTQTWRSLHNFTLFVYSGFICFGTLWYLYDDGQLFSWHALLCTPVEGTILRPMSVTFTISKLVEWVDTAFIYWTGKHPPQFLHLYHHATTFWLFCMVVNMPGTEKFGMLMNGFVHTLMYSHYWRSWPKSLVWIITVLQIVQLATVTYTWTVNPAECPTAEFATGYEKYPLAFNTPYAMVPVFLFFFLKFFVNRFILGKAKAGSKKETAKAKTN